VNGCHTLNEASVIVNGNSQVLTKEGETNTCNYLMGRATQQTTFKTVVQSADNVVFEAMVDQHFGLSVNPSEVSPSGFVNDPQLHLSKLRTQESYRVEKNGKFVVGGKKIRLNKDQCKVHLS